MITNIYNYKLNNIINNKLNVYYKYSTANLIDELPAVVIFDIRTGKVSEVTLVSGITYLWDTIKIKYVNPYK